MDYRQHRDRVSALSQIGTEYYKAYDKRYSQVHSLGMNWFSDNPSPELSRWVESKGIAQGETILDLGCGEGRDLKYILSLGYDAAGTDISPAAIRHVADQSVLPGKSLLFTHDIVEKPLPRRFDWICSIGVLHMLVEASDRDSFLRNLYLSLTDRGKALVVVMGNGESERSTDPSEAFLDQKRRHGASGKELMIASTSCRIVSRNSFRKELEKAGFLIEEIISSVNPEYGETMSAWLSR